MQNGDTPLHMAAFGGATEVAEWLLQQHIDLNSVNKVSIRYGGARHYQF